MPALRALLLDFDGTVADTNELIYRCLDETARELLGLEFPRLAWRRHIGRPLREMFALLGSPSSTVVDRLIEDYRARQDRYLDQVEAFPGLIEALSELRARGIRLALVTTKLQRIARRQLAVLGIEREFEAVIGFDDCERPKPDPQPFVLALRALAVSPAEAAAVGDTPMDIQGARAAGVLAVGALWCAAAREQLLAAQPDRTLAAPAELLSLLRNSD